MRIELLYAPGCNSYAKARQTLEALIADEGLPIHVECIEEAGQEHPAVMVDGTDKHHFETGSSESVRELLVRKWQELTEHPLRKVHL